MFVCRRAVVGWLAGLALLAGLLAGCGSSGSGGDDAAPPPGGRRPGSGDGTAATTSAPESSPTGGATTTTILAATGQCGLEGPYPQPWPERPRYRATLTVDPPAGTVEGETAVEFVPPEATDRIVLRLWANMPRVGQGGGSMVLHQVAIDGAPAEFSYEDGGAGPGTPGTIAVVAGDYPAGVAVQIETSFTLELPGAINERVARVGDAARLGSILPLLAWVRGEGWHTSPAVSNFSEAVASEVADYDVTVRAPDGFTVLATGEEVEPGRFVASGVRDWAATVAPMRVVRAQVSGGRTEVVVGVHEALGDDADALLDLTVRSLEDFAARYGPYPYPSLSVGVTGSLSGGIEFPQHIHLGSGTSSDHLVHEVAHMWFYALVGNDQYEHPWLDEGLTEYAESRFLRNEATKRATSIPADARGRLGASHQYWASHTSSFFRGVYIQGAQALAAVGDAAGGLDAVDCALRRYVLEHAFGVAEPGDLVDAVRAQTGVDPVPILERFGGP